jgi:hypothetical protein
VRNEAVQPEAIRRNKVVGRWTRAALLIGIVYFGFIFPDSLSDHTKILHFAAHMGMSFFIASCIYVVCNLMLRMKKAMSLTVLIVVTTIIGGIYKYLEIASEGMLHNDYNLGFVLKITGCYTSMSQNTSGLLAAILLIEYLVQYVRTKGYLLLRTMR